MANDAILGPNARFHGWQNSLGTCVNCHLADLGLAAGVMGAEIGVKVGDPPPPSRLATPDNATLRRR